MKRRFLLVVAAIACGGLLHASSISSSFTSGIAQYFAPTGLTGATAASRYVGGTTSGAPASGTFSVGDFTIDQTGRVYVCTVAGTPGTWSGSGLKRVVTLTDAATIASNCDTTDEGIVTITASRTLGAPTGTPVDCQQIIYRVRQDGTGTWALSFNAAFRFSADLPSPTINAGAGKTSYLGFAWNATDSKWDCIAYNGGF